MHVERCEISYSSFFPYSPQLIVIDFLKKKDIIVEQNLFQIIKEVSGPQPLPAVCPGDPADYALREPRAATGPPSVSP